MTNDDVTEKLQYARRRADDIKSMIADRTLGALYHDRQQLIQEFFFHAAGASVAPGGGAVGRVAETGGWVLASLSARVCDLAEAPAIAGPGSSGRSEGD